MNSTHKVEVVPVALIKHPNADTLSVVNVFGGYTCVVRTEDWADKKIGAYIPPDSLVDTSLPMFQFLSDRANAESLHRVKAKKLRGIVSFGMLVPAPEGSAIGDDVAELLKVQHYEPRIATENRVDKLHTGGEAGPPPKTAFVKFDVDSFRRYHNVLDIGETVWVTEKIHGASARYTFCDGQMYCGSRNEWKRELPCYDHITMDWLRSRILKDDGTPNEEECARRFERLHNTPKARNMWWRVLDVTPSIEAFCRSNPGFVLYGEVYGQVMDLRYGHTPDNPLAFAAFDIAEPNGEFLDPQAARQWFPEPWVPVLNPAMLYTFDKIVAESDGPSCVKGAAHYREGCVVKPIKERWDVIVGRVCLKCVGSTYLEKSK